MYVVDFQAVSDYFVLAHIIAGHNAKATISFSIRGLLINEFRCSRLSKNGLKKTNTIQKLKTGRCLIQSLIGYRKPLERCLILIFIVNILGTNFDGGFNTTMAIDSEMI